MHGGGGRARQPILFGQTDALDSSPFLETGQVCEQVSTNVGNLAFVYALKRQIVGLEGRANVPWNSTPAQVRRAGDICVIPCANQFGPHYDFGGPATRLDRIDVPLVAVGLGTQSNLDLTIPDVPEGTVRWVRSIMEHAPSTMPNVSIRGEFSRRVLDAYGFHDVCVVGCPSLFLNPSTTLGRSIADRQVDIPGRVAVAAGHPDRLHLAPIEHSLAQIVTATNGAYVCQSPFESIRMGRGEVGELNATEVEQLRKYVYSGLSTDEFKTWVKAHATVFFNVPGWMEFLRRFDFVVGMRIHGTVLGLQAGVPALCIASDSRTLELCQTMRIPHVLSRNCIDAIDGFNLEKLSRLFRDQFDPDLFDTNRNRLAASYCAFLEGNGLIPTPAMRSLAN